MLLIYRGHRRCIKPSDWYRPSAAHSEGRRYVFNDSLTHYTYSTVNNLRLTWAAQRPHGGRHVPRSALRWPPGGAKAARR